MTDMAVLARKTWRTLEPIHGMIYFVPEAMERYAAIGIDEHRMGYFGSRSAAMGAVPAGVVISTFFNFHPGLVRRSVPAVWDRVTPTQLLDARLDAADAALLRAWPDMLGSAELARAAELARRAAEAACQSPEGRPLFAGHADLPWPDDAHLVLWHAQSLLREFRGDAHVAALMLEGLTGVEALVSHAAAGDVPADVLRSTRAWPAEEWDAAVERLRSRGLLTGDDAPTFTPEGEAQRRRIEDRTDAASVPAYAPLGDDVCAELRDLARPFSRAIVSGGLLSSRLPEPNVS